MHRSFSQKYFLFFTVSTCALLFFFGLGSFNHSSASTLISLTPLQPTPSVAPTGCVRAGCSGQLCVEATAEQPITHCAFLPEYVCLQAATCERQATGQCGFTQTPELQACLNAVSASPTPAPSPTPVPSGSITWQTHYASIKASEFTIATPNGAFISTTNNFRVTSDPGTDTYTTLEASWQENGVEMRMFIYFAQANGQWRVTELRTYNGNANGDWQYFSGEAFGTAAVGQKITKSDLTLNSNDNQGKVIFKNLELQGFLPKPSPSISPAGYYVEPKPFGTVEFGVSDQTSGYSVIAILKDAQGETITDQSDMKYVWTSQNSQIVTVTGRAISVGSECVSGILAPCPELWGDMKGISPGSTTVTVTISRKSTNAPLATYSFPIKITGTASSPQPTPSATPISVRPGDINYDGKVNLFDYAMLLNDLFETGPNLASDLNNDQKVNILDYSILLELLDT